MTRTPLRPLARVLDARAKARVRQFIGSVGDLAPGVQSQLACSNLRLVASRCSQSFFIAHRLGITCRRNGQQDRKRGPAYSFHDCSFRKRSASGTRSGSPARVERRPFIQRQERAGLSLHTGHAGSCGGGGSGPSPVAASELETNLLN